MNHEEPVSVRSVIACQFAAGGWLLKRCLRLKVFT